MKVCKVWYELATYPQPTTYNIYLTTYIYGSSREEPHSLTHSLTLFSSAK
jgi:hypothetical protein